MAIKSNSGENAPATIIEPGLSGPRLTISGPRLTITDPRQTGRSKLPLRPGLAPRTSFISISLRNVTAAISNNLRIFSASQNAPIKFHIKPSDLSSLAAERTLLALAEVLERALDEEQNTTHLLQGNGNESLENGNKINDVIDSPFHDSESPDGQGEMYSNVRALIKKMRFLEEQPTTENIKQQKRVAADAAANALATLVLKSSPITGLDLLTNSQQIQQRQELFGINAMKPKRLTTFLQFCWEAIQDPVLLLLICLGVISTVVEMTLGHKPGETCTTCWIEGAAIIFAVFVVVIVTSSIGYKKQLSFIVLSKTLEVSNTKSVLRNGKINSITDAEIVVGDILNVNSHNAANIPADCVLLGSFADSFLQMDESSLTGESETVMKRPGDVILSGTTVIQGSGKLVVVAVGVNSVAGKIKARVYDSAERHEDLEGDDETPLFSKLSRLAKQIGMIGTAAAILAFFASLILGLAVKKDPAIKIVEYFIVSITVLAVAVPEGLPLAVTLSLAFSSQCMTKDQNLVKHLDACETMGCATTICTDKTGERTQIKTIFFLHAAPLL
jgi:calcium-translocating P-type ATPase